VDQSLSGPKSRFRGKLRGPRTMSITFTPDGHAALARVMAAESARSGRPISRSDCLELLVRRSAAARTDLPSEAHVSS
jgi:hypothetical protein